VAHRSARPTLVLLAALAVIVAAGCDKVETRPTPSDTYVSADAPTTAYGAATQLFVDSSPQRETFLQFDLSDVTNTLVEAKLRLHVADTSNAGSPDGGQVAAITTAPWSESTLTYADRPTTWGPTVADIGAVTANTWVEVGVTAAVTPGGVVTLGIRSSNSDGATYDSRESGANAPQLVVTTGPPRQVVEGITIAAVGDMACAPGGAVTATACRQQQVSDDLLADTDVTQLLALGDLQYDVGALSAFQTSYETSYGRLKPITKPVAGNHEYGTSGAAGYFTYFGAAAGDTAEGYYSYDIGTSWHVVVLNSNCTIVSCAAGSAQEQWLRADLAATARPCVMAAWHHPRFTSSLNHTNDPAVAPFWDALQEYGADIVLGGHVHNYERFAPQLPNGVADQLGIRQFIVGTGGKSRYGFAAAQPNSVVRFRSFGYLKMVLGDPHYAWQFIDESGNVLDAGSSTCH
jgi:hypothetical protein